MTGASRHILLLTMIVLSCSACGLKGALYLPQERAKNEQQQKKDRTTPPTSSTTGPVGPTDSTRPPAATPPPEN